MPPQSPQERRTMRTCALLVAAVAFASMCHLAQAVTLIPPPATTVSGTCQAAHDADSRVNTSFCITHLRKEPRAIDADIPGLADAAAAAGVRNADAARSETTQRTPKRRDEGDDERDDPIYRRALERCEWMYGMVREAYVAARDAIAEQRYGEVERELASATSTAHWCDSGFALARGGGAPSPFVQYGEDNTQIALLTAAIISLIK